MANVSEKRALSEEPFASDARIRAASLSGFVQMLKTYDLDPAPLLAKASISAKSLEDPFVGSRLRKSPSP